MASHWGNLRPAHSGYRYQDIAAAYVLIRSIVERYDRVVVDQKQVDDDRIDDLEVVSQGKTLRRQFKSSKDSNRQITSEDFTRANSSLRFDRLVLTYVRAGASAADEYRLCATWRPPASDDILASLLEPVDAERTVEFSSSQCFRLRGDLLWPANTGPLFAPLNAFAQTGAEFGRLEVLAFCKRFSVELSLPSASSTLADPGPLESALIANLSERVGIGRYPNHGRSPIDVAALAVSLANLARTQMGSLTPSDIERELAILTDFGRVAQAFPLDETLFQDRPTFRRTLKESALAGIHQLLTGPPGAGKSWELTKLADELREAGAIVARHYCYLEPGDELIERRVTTDVFFGNLLADLTDAVPELTGAAKTRYAAGLSELEETLSKASGLNRPVVLIVDGLDHIARVRAEAPSLAINDTDIVERLATIEMPPGMVFVIGSQPGPHLDLLCSRWKDTVVNRQIPRWAEADIEALAERHGVVNTLAAVGISDADETAGILQVLANRVDGNPLYGRYLARGLVGGMRDGSILNPRDWIAEAPAIGGDIAGYYAYLYRAASREALAIADVLGVIDFSVTEADLREMVAFAGDWVPAALSKLAPVLAVATAQGGVRIFHESFRRFMAAEQTRQGRSPSTSLKPVIAWLDSRGFYENAKSYRFLLPALRRAGRESEIPTRVGVSFVSDSVSHAHPPEAIQRNLALAADVAARLGDWPRLVRCVELHRAAYTCFDGSHNWNHFWPAYLELFGAAAVADRLMFDGRPTQPSGEGLIACSLIDDAGGTAPWREYLELERETNDPHVNNGERVTLAAVHGRLRIGSPAKVVRGLYEDLSRNGNDFKILLIRKLSMRLARMGQIESVERIANRGTTTYQPGSGITLRAAAVLRLGLADEYVHRGDDLSAIKAATAALEGADTPELAVSCIAFGAPAEDSRRVAAKLQALPIAVGPDDYLSDSSGVRTWVASVRLIATDPDAGAAALAAERQRIDGVGWYRCWLRFVLATAGVDAARRTGADGDIAGAFAELTRDMHPFTGQPRACDLYSIWNVIEETLGWALSLLRTEDEWRSGLGSLSSAHESTGSRLDREDSGPIPTGTLLDLLMAHANNPVAGAIVRNVIELEVIKRDRNGTYYSTHAEYAMRLARAYKIGGNAEASLDAWTRAGVYLGGYGFHKDVTVYEVINSAPSLCAVSQQTAIRALADLQPLTAAVIAHTDHRETKHAPNTWFHKLLKVDPHTAIVLLARTVMSEDGTGGWPIADAIRDAAQQVADSANPLLVDAILRTVNIDADDARDVEKAITIRLSPVVRLAATDRLAAQDILNRVLTEISDDVRKNREIAAVRVKAIAEELNLDNPQANVSPTAQAETEVVEGFDSRSHLRPTDSWLKPPVFPPDPTFVDLLKGLRTASLQLRWDDPRAWDHIVTSLGYRIPEMIEGGREEDAQRLLLFFAREATQASGKAHPLADLAGSLDVSGYSRTASIAYTLAYTKTRGGMGWFHLGDGSHAHLLNRAIELDRDAALRVLADELAYTLRGNWYSAGTSRHLIDRIAEWGDAGIAEAAWREAFAVIAHRLPLAPRAGWFAPLNADDIPDWTVDEALFALLLAKLSDPRLRQKIASLEGVVTAFRKGPDLVPRGLRWWLEQTPGTTSVLLVLAALIHSEGAPFPISRQSLDVFRGQTATALWGVRRFSLILIRRLDDSVSVAEVTVPSLDTTGVPVMSERRRTQLLHADMGDSLEVVSSLWPELPDLVLRRLHTTLERDPDTKDRSEERYRLAWGRDGRSVPLTPVLLWQSEVFVEAFHTELTGLRAQLWASGRWNPEVEDALLLRVMPDTFVHLGLATSRVARPQWDPPALCTNGLGPLPILNSHPSLTGWRRLAIVERQYISDSDDVFGRPREVVRIYAGAVAVPLGEAILTDAFPFRVGQPRDWWSEQASERMFPPRLPLGPLIGLARTTDWLGDALVLVPPMMLRNYITLRSASYCSPMTWSDSNGLPAVRLRTWRVRNGNAHDSDPFEYEGADLIARSDVVERMQNLCGVQLQELRSVKRRALEAGEDGE